MRSGSLGAYFGGTTTSGRAGQVKERLLARDDLVNALLDRGLTCVGEHGRRVLLAHSMAAILKLSLSTTRLPSTSQATISQVA